MVIHFRQNMAIAWRAEDWLCNEFLQQFFEAAQGVFVIGLAEPEEGFFLDVFVVIAFEDGEQGVSGLRVGKLR